MCQKHCGKVKLTLEREPEAQANDASKAVLQVTCQLLPDTSNAPCAFCHNERSKLISEVSTFVEHALVVTCSCPNAEQAHVGCLKERPTLSCSQCGKKTSRLDELRLSGVVVVLQCAVDDISGASLSTGDVLSCRICNEGPLFGDGGSPTQRMIFWPCLCSKPIHRKCTKELLTHAHRCSHCGMKFRIQSFGSFRDYYGRNRCLLITSISLVLLLVLIFVCIRIQLANQSLNVYCLVSAALLMVLLVVALVRTQSGFGKFQRRFAVQQLLPFRDRKQIRFVTSLAAESIF
ncbi:hypothetical protein L596_002831 [Steinernema carpocapsae]|uniref:RING-CH-type domain-containing protein n=2 Tax=Steinernema carpocapsae TaxID=34508 RepID=A0A4V6I7J1_STECR|nr:hypothetical protein L596_002831 [Steinernema carpocapsae]